VVVVRGKEARRDGEVGNWKARERVRVRVERRHSSVRYLLSR
jgi:hypothetical protein